MGVPAKARAESFKDKLIRAWWVLRRGAYGPGQWAHPESITNDQLSACFVRIDQLGFALQKLHDKARDIGYEDAHNALDSLAAMKKGPRLSPAGG